MDRDFERFNGGPTVSPLERIHVTISRQSVILLNENAYRLIGKPDGVYLHFSRTRDTIAIEPASSRLPAAFPVRFQSNGGTGGRRINAAPFCRHFGISPDTTLRFISPKLENNALHLKLSETVSVGNRRRQKK